MDEDALKIEGLAAQLYVRSHNGGAYVWWHLLRSDVKKRFRSEAEKKIAQYVLTHP